jgi:hypothetical protein
MDGNTYNDDGLIVNLISVVCFATVDGEHVLAACFPG